MKKKFVFENGEVHVTYVGVNGFNFNAYLGLIFTKSEYGYVNGQPSEEAARLILLAMAEPKNDHIAQAARANTLANS